jgi:TRAP-type C4-dicarboxylate transport system permease large subunit
MVLVVPITYPTLTAMHFDPVWFGVLVVLTAMMGLITPPVGMAVYAVTGMVKDVPMFTIFRGIWPHLYAMLVAMVILIAFPQISLVLPNLMKPG